MGEDRALDEFLGEDDKRGSSERSECLDGNDETSANGGETAVGNDAHTEATGERDGGAVSTTAFAPDGAPCESCGASVCRRWRDDGALVCTDCKAW